MTTEFFASMMCADYGHLEDEVRALESGGIDAFHIDIMDGEFVHNFGMGIHDLRYIRSATKKSVECHLMIREPMRFVELFADCGANVLYVHPESEYHTSTTLQRVSDLGLTPAIAINPGTSVEYIRELLYIVERVLVMSVNPGHAGQIYLPYIHNKICKLLELRDEYGFNVYWDGHGSLENVRKYTELGVRGFVLGTAALFDQNRAYKEILDELREIG